MTTILDPHCRCCDPATPLLPRADLEPGLAACPRSGRLHRAGTAAFELISAGPALATRTQAPAARPVIRIDLSKEGYA